MSGFRFDFQMPSPSSQPMEEGKTEDEQQKQQTLSCDQTDESCNDDTRTPNGNNPVVFLQDIPSLLRQRSQQNVQYDTITLTNKDETNFDNDDDARNELLRARIQTSNSTKNNMPPPSSEATTTVPLPNENESEIVQDLERQQTDILPGVYEGGLKVWECSLDLCQYMVNHMEDMLLLQPPDGSDYREQGTYILELGCGQALPGCFLLREGLKKLRQTRQQEHQPFCVLFTDYNEFVLRDVTISNIVLNTRQYRPRTNPSDPLSSSGFSEKDADDISNHIVIAAGDWMDLSRKLLQQEQQPQQQGEPDTTSSPPSLAADNKLPPNGRFHIILAAETTYTSKSAQDTAILMAKHLTFHTGIGLVATKRYYFGVGGGSDAFRDAAASQRVAAAKGQVYCLSVETLEVYDNGAGNIRELLCVKLIPQK